MAKTTRQTAIFGVEDWKRFYQTFREADFQSYDFETLRKSFIDYLRLYYPETFNDYIESSEFIALLDVMAFMGQALAFRNDLNARENFLDTAERRDSVVRLANLVSYTPKRNTAGQGFLKIFSVSSTENLTDFNGINLSNVTVDWNDPTNPNWLEQFTLIINAALVDSQKFGRPGNSQDLLGIRTDEYSLNLVPGFLPVVPFNSTVDGISMPFEAVSSTSIGRDYVYEPAPRPSGRFNILYRNDQLGFGSEETGFFFLFKQGVLQNQDFNLAEALPNRTVNINVEGCNEEDHWLFKLDDIGSIESEWIFSPNIYAAAVEQLEPGARRFYSITSRTNDQITLTFGDGVFAEIPVGIFRAYVRASNGLRYIINPEEIQSVPISIGYVGRSGRVESITFTVGITTPITNSQPRETIDAIKQRAPARYYTQNRMVNGEDYNNFPFTLYNSIVKSKAVARSSIGVSRYVDLTDVTGKYSSTNVYASDGVFYRQAVLPSFEFTWFNSNDIATAITTQVEPLLRNRNLTQFYYADNFVDPDEVSSGTVGYFEPTVPALSPGTFEYEYQRPTLKAAVPPYASDAQAQIFWNQSTALANSVTGFFKNVSDVPVPIAQFSSTNAKFVTQASLIKFEPPAGSYFDRRNRLIQGTPTSDTDKLVIWATVLTIIGDSTAAGAGNLPDGSGPVIINQMVPTGALATQVIPKFVTDLPTAFERTMLQEIELLRKFGIGYDINTASWYLITQTNLADIDVPFLRSSRGSSNDSTWLIRFDNVGATYTVSYRGLEYVFASVIENRFFFDGAQKVFDGRTGKTITDFVNILKVNSRPDSNLPLSSDVVVDIVDQPVESDGYVNDYQVVVSYRDSDADGIADNPDFFNDVVAPDIDYDTKFVFFQQTVDFDNLERYLPVMAGTVNTEFTTLEDIEVAKSEFLDGQVFFTTGTKEFYRLTVDVVNGLTQRVLTLDPGWRAAVGRQSLAFQYRHNSPLTNVIDPGVTNIIDIYLVPEAYYTAYQNYIRDTTDTVLEPPMPTIAELTTAYSRLNDFKMVSDNIVLNSVIFKPLFGVKAAPELRATIKVVRAPKSTASVTEIKTQVISNINAYFSIDKWDFGDSFFFSELAAYLHQRLGSIISSVVLVPLNPLKTFGDLYEVRSAPNEIFVTAATVNDVEVIEALTQSNIRSQTPVSGLYGVTTVGAPTSLIGQNGGGGGFY
jgi:hypothetical protein